MKLLSILKKNLILEISQKKKNQLLDKFSAQTTDDREKIGYYIDEFEKYKNGLPVDKRDLLRYSYEELKGLIVSKETSKGFEEIFKEFKKKEKNVDDAALKKDIKRFLEIQSILPKEKQNISKYSYLNLVDLLQKSYSQLLNKILIEKFTKENPNLTIPQIVFYIDEYINNFDDIPITTKGVDKMSFSELEHLIDGLASRKQEGEKTKTSVEDVEMLYDENNLKVFAPKTKDQCIRLRNGRSWCTSREGSSNMYYNYRLDSNKTLYYVIDEDKDFDNLNFAVVILVDPQGDTALADGSNSGRYAGSTNMPWSEITQKVPKLANLKSLFVPKPLTQEEKELIQKVRSVRVGDNPIESFQSEQMAELWLEILSPRLTDTQYINLTNKLKKKYIALGMELSGKMLINSESDILKYYIKRNLEQIRQKRLGSLTEADIVMLNLPMMQKIKEELKSRFLMDASSTTQKDNKKFEIQYPSGLFSKFVALYGFSELFKSLPEDLESFVFANKGGQPLELEIPDSFTKFKNLEAISLENCVNEIPENIGNLKNLKYLSLVKNPNLKRLPESVLKIPTLFFINLMGSNPELPEGLFDMFSKEDTGEGYVLMRA